MAKSDKVEVDGIPLTRDQIERARQLLPAEPAAPVFLPGTIVGLNSKRGPATVGVVVLGEGAPEEVCVTTGYAITYWLVADVQRLGHIADFIPRVEMK